MIVRDELLSRSILTPLLGACTPQASLVLLRGATACLASFTRQTPQSRFAELRLMLPILAQLLYALDDEVMTHTLTALVALSDEHGSAHAQIQSVIESGVSRRVVELMMHKSPSIKTAALAVVSNICRGDDVQRQVILNCSALNCLMALLVNPKKAIRRDTCTALSLICQGNKQQLQHVIDANIIPPLIQILRTEDFALQKEGAAALSHMLTGGTASQIRDVVSFGVIPALSGLLSCPDAAVILLALAGLESVLRVGAKDAQHSETSNQYAEMLEECDGIDALEALQKHDSEDVYTKAVEIIEKYFADEADETQP